MKSLLAAILCIVFAADVLACGRCGLFGNRCRYHAPHYVAPIAYTPPATQTNFIFSNSFPVPYLLAPQGQSVYGYSLASAAYQLDPALYLDRAARFTEQANENARLGIEGFTSTTNLALQLNDAADRRHKNAVLALSAMEANSHGSQSLAFRATVQGGKLAIERFDPNTPQAILDSAECAKCHDGSGRGGVPKGLTLDGSVPLTAAQLESSINAVVSGRMPPKSQLSAEQKTSVIVSLNRLLGAPDATEGELK